LLVSTKSYLVSTQISINFINVFRASPNKKQKWWRLNISKEMPVRHAEWVEKKQEWEDGTAIVQLLTPEHISAAIG
jgi:hypothetical protein